MKQFLSLKQVADLLGVDYKTVFNLVRTGQLPAARIGNIYRVRKEDLDQFFERQKQQPGGEVTPIMQRTEAGVPKSTCGRCGLVIKYPSLVGGACQQESCATILCKQCWLSFPDRRCSLHQAVPPGAAPAMSGEVVVLSSPGWGTGSGFAPIAPAARVTAEEAIQWELQFIEGFDQGLRERSSIQSPIDGHLHKVTDWDALHHKEPALLPPKKSVSSVLSQGRAASSLPQDLTSCYHFRQDEHHLSPSSFALVAVTLNHLEAYQSSGADSEPVTLEELLKFIKHASDFAKRNDTLYVAGLASPTGWSREAIEGVIATSERPGFSVLHLSFCLMDLRTRALSYLSTDFRLQPHLNILRGLRKEDLVRRIQKHIQDALLVREGQSEKEVAQATGQPEELVKRAFELLRQGGGYEIYDVPGTGRVISRVR